MKDEQEEKQTKKSKILPLLIITGVGIGIYQNEKKKAKKPAKSKASNTQTIYYQNPTPNPTPPDPTPPDPTPPPPTGDGGPDFDENATCVNFANHGEAGPHLFADSRLNKFVGTVLSPTRPQFKIEGETDWAIMTHLGDTTDGKKMWIYRANYNNQERYAWLRSHEGCTETRDIRPQSPKANRRENWIELLNLPPLSNKSSELLQPLIVSDMHVVDDAADFATMYQCGILTNDSYNFRLYDKRGTSAIAENNFTQATQRNFNDNKAGYDYKGFANIDIGKDFIMDIEKNGQYQRFVAHRYHIGGHFTDITTFTRHDGNVFVVSQYAMNTQFQQYAIVNGNRKDCHPLNGTCINLGVLNDGDHYVSLYSSSHNQLIVSNLLVRVKAMQ